MHQFLVFSEKEFSTENLIFFSISLFYRQECWPIANKLNGSNFYVGDGRVPIVDFGFMAKSKLLTSSVILSPQSENHVETDGLNSCRTSAGFDQYPETPNTKHVSKYVMNMKWAIFWCLFSEPMSQIFVLTFTKRY